MTGATAVLLVACTPLAESKAAESKKPGAKVPPAPEPRGRAKRALKAVAGTLPLVAMAWLLSSLAASAGAPKWLAATVAGLVLSALPGWHFFAERRRKRAGKPDGSLTRHDRYILRSVLALGAPLAIVLVFFRGAAWDALDDHGLWFAETAPMTRTEQSIERLRYLPKDTVVAIDMSAVDAEGRPWLVPLFQGKLELIGEHLPIVFAVGEKAEQTAFVFRYRDVKKTLASWKKTTDTQRDAWSDPDEDHIAVRAGEGSVILCREEWYQAVVDAIDSVDRSASTGPLRRAAELAGEREAVLTFLGQNVRFSEDITVEVGYIVWTRTEKGVTLRAGVGGSSDSRKAAEQAVKDRFASRAAEFPVLAKLELKTRTEHAILEIRLAIPTETLQAILLQPKLFTF